MRPWPSIFSQEMFRSTTVVGLVLVVGSLVALGALCVKQPVAQTNTSVNTAVALNTTPGTNSSISNGNGNTNSSQNTNSSEIDTSDWQTYTNEEYGFSFRYPSNLPINIDSPAEPTSSGTVLNFDFFLIRLIQNSSQLEISDWLKKNVDIKNHLTFLSSVSTTGITMYQFRGAEDLSDIGEHGDFYFADPSNQRVFLVIFTQDHTITERYGYSFSILPQIINTFQFNQ